MTDTPNAVPAAEQARSVAVPGARGWYRYGEGAVNVRASGAVGTPQWDDGLTRVVVAGSMGNYELQLGPYDDGGEATAVADALLRLAYDDAAWPT